MISYLTNQDTSHEWREGHNEVSTGPLLLIDVYTMCWTKHASFATIFGGVIYNEMLMMSGVCNRAFVVDEQSMMTSSAK